MLDSLNIRKLQPGSVLDGHVHDVLGFPEPIWPYSTHPNAQGRLWEWLKSHSVQVWLPGRNGYPGDDCVIKFQRFPREHFHAASQPHALCLAVLLTHYLIQHGRHFPVSNCFGLADRLNE